MAQVKLGSAGALDAGLVTLDHPDGLNALMSGAIDAHFTSPPFQFQEKVRGAHVVARSYNYFGAHTFLVNVMTQKFYDENRAFSQQFYRDIVAMHKLIETNPVRAANLLSKDAGGIPTWRQFKQWIGNPALTWTTRPRGLMRYAAFMNRTNQLDKMPSSWRELVFPPVHATRGS
jgi:NitT/TauT family transport system substrate-binding protein